MTEPADYARDAFDSSGVLDDVPLTVEESLDSDDLGDTDAGLDPLDDSWDAPDRPSAETRHRPTATEGRAGASLDDQLAQEVPDVDPYLEAERSESGLVLDDDVEGINTPFGEDGSGSRLTGLVADDASGPGGDVLTGRRTEYLSDRETWPLAPEEDALHLD
ncbi:MULTISPECIES: hypothetical protein [unclassified Pseudofrankia]|uniref:hypothetical protein n=1 Tax=unclassified Pseudofrankia TaxID=2994372 RepID=UPI0008DA4647|nr:MULTISPECIES: hypothetical protein [unclassified Pseudofrankia]MDT3438850.1 hypothetical protein [Pseudofrankia sp. BMG5.37]OHV75219.1 hypothetical protein BCD48_00345 [Pseudofrankia sp. BMG5.36]